jgi:hypothetical protein
VGHTAGCRIASLPLPPGLWAQIPHFVRFADRQFRQIHLNKGVAHRFLCRKELRTSTRDSCSKEVLTGRDCLLFDHSHRGVPAGGADRGANQSLVAGLYAHGAELMVLQPAVIFCKSPQENRMNRQRDRINPIQGLKAFIAALRDARVWAAYFPFASPWAIFVPSLREGCGQILRLRS